MTSSPKGKGQRPKARPSSPARHHQPAKDVLSPPAPSTQHPAPTISACLIVKDEAANLPRCLESLRAAVDEIVVVDTGSRDATIELAKAAGARVSTFEWSDDFSAARNESLRLATSDWLLWIDADEELVLTEPNALRQLVASVCHFERRAEPALERSEGNLPAGSGGGPNSKSKIQNSTPAPSTQHLAPDPLPWGYFLEQRSPRGEQAPMSVVKQWRLFPNHRNILFQGRIHEHPAAPEPISPSAVLETAAAYIQHWGYLPDAQVMARKLARNRRLIELSIAAEPEQPRHYFNLGMQLLAEDDSRQALAVLRKGIERWFVAHGLDLGYVPGMFTAAAQAAWNLADYAGVLDIERTTPAELTSSELLLTAGRAWLQLGRADEAAARFERAVNDRLAVANTLHDPSCVEQARAELAQIQNSNFKIQNPQYPAPSTQHSALSTRHSISACMIVRDEEQDLPRCLASLQGVVDEIVVVDTGSIDRTIEIATQAGAQVFHFAWVDDFSAARNESLRHATGDFIIWIDGDDELREAEPGALRRACRDMPESAWGYWVDVVCPTDQWSEGETVLKQCRILRNHSGIQFQGRLHEQALPPSGDARTLAHQNKVSIKHWGYIPNGSSAKDRSERNVRLLRLAIAEHPDDPFQHHNLGLQLLADKEFAPAWETLSRAIQVWRDNPPEHDGFVPAMFGLAAMAAMELGLFEEVLRVEAETPAQYVCSELLLPAGIAAWRLGRNADAIARFQRAIGDAAAINSNNHDRSSSTWRPELQMACVYTDLGDYPAAYEHARKSIEFAPSRPETLFVLAHVSHQLGKREEALAWSRTLLAGDRDDGYKPQTRALLLRMANEADDGSLALEALAGPVDKLTEAEAVIVRARAYALLGSLQEQYDTLDAGCRAFPDNPRIRLELAELLEAQGYLQEATNVLGAAVDLPDAPAELYQRLARVLARQGQVEDASNALRIAKIKSEASEPAVVG